MRPVSKPANNPNYNPPATLTFTGANANILRDIWSHPGHGSYTSAIEDFLDLWLEDATGVQFYHVTPQEQSKIISAIKERIGNVYKTASAPLTQDLGDFCSFCGTPLPGLLEVEHAVPKSQYPTFATDWANFLLCCGPCNTAKGDKPSRATAKPWTGQASPTEQQYYDAIRLNHYDWPDLNATCWNDLPMQLQYVNPLNGQWTILASPDDTNLNNKLTGYDVVNHRVYANINVTGTGMLNNVQVAVTVGSANTHGMQARAVEMINQMAFNNDVTNPLSGTYDRRVMNRTRAWFFVLEKLKLLATTTNQNEFDLLWPMVPMAGAVTGFYSVWLTVLDNFWDFNGGNCASRFVADTNAPLYFPNTDVTYIS